MMNERGITLAEILAATAVIAIGLVGLGIVIPMSMYGVHEGNALSTSAFLAMEKLEEIRNASWTVSPTPDGVDCLGLGSSAAPTSTTCTRSLPTACTSGTSCETFADESAVPNYPAYSRTVRFYDCNTVVPPNTSAGCAGVSSSDLRLARVAVSYRPISGVGGSGANAAKSTSIEMVIARRP